MAPPGPIAAWGREIVHRQGVTWQWSPAAAPDRRRGGGTAAAYAEPVERVITRRLGLVDAVVIGLGSMLGAGVFAAFAPAAAAAGTGLLVGLGLAGLVAFCNATSSARLAARYPVFGGSYVYGREVLGPWAGFFAGWAFIVGKTASAAAMALTFAAYAVPEAWVKPVAVLAVAALTLVNTRGVTRTAAVTRVLVTVALLALAVVVAIGGTATPAGVAWRASEWTVAGVLQAAAFLFFAFAGYARIATMGEEVSDPERTIPRAITIALILVLVIYAVVGFVALRVLGPDGLAGSAAPLAEVAATAGEPWVGVVAVGAAAAALGALLALVAGIGRTAVAMARTGDLPRWLAALHPRFEVPQRAELVLGAVVCVLVLATDLRGAIGFSSFGVLLYYFVANAAAFRAPGPGRLARVLPAVGALGCLALAAALPLASVAGGLVVLAAGLLYRLVRVRLVR